MNCDDYRQLITADPSSEEGGEHLSQCDACRAYRLEMQAFDQQILKALALDVPAPRVPELPAVDTSKVTSLAGRRRFKAPAWFAVAATVTLAAFLGLRTQSVDVSDLTLADQILEHLDHERGSLVVSDQPVSDSRLARVVPAKIANLDHSAGLITYAQSCKINGVEVPHLVIQGEHGPVTILLMPGQPVDGPESITGESVNGVIIPVGDGSIAIIGEDGENLDRIQNNVRDSVTWDI